MPVCEICGKKNLKNPNHPNHVNSERHQSALKMIDKGIGKEKQEIIIDSKFEEIEKILLKERIYNYIYLKKDNLKVSEVILYFQKFFPKEKINSLLIELYFENLIDFRPKIPSEIEKLLIILNKEIELKFPLSIKINKLEELIGKRYLDFEKIVSFLKYNPEFVDLSLISIGKPSQLIIFKNIWKLNSLVWSI